MTCGLEIALGRARTVALAVLATAAFEGRAQMLYLGPFNRQPDFPRGGDARVSAWVGGNHAFVAYEASSTSLVLSLNNPAGGSSPRSVLSPVPPAAGPTVAANADRVGVVWTDSDGGFWALRFRQGDLTDAGVLALLPVETVASGPDPIGLGPSLDWTVGREPVIATFDYGVGYGGSLSGCGSTASYRLTPRYRRAGGWVTLGHCRQSSASAEGASLVLSPVGNGTFFAAAHFPDAGAHAIVFDPTLPANQADLGEPALVVALSARGTSVFSSAPGRATSTDVMLLYEAADGGLWLGVVDTLQRGASTAVGSSRLVSDIGFRPALSAPSDASGCYVASWQQGSNRLGFRLLDATGAPLIDAGMISALTGSYAASDVTEGHALEHGVGSLDHSWLARSADAGVWMVGRMASNPANAVIQSSVAPNPAYADGLTAVKVRFWGFRDRCGLPLAPGVPVSIGSLVQSRIASVDEAPGLPGTQVLVDSDGGITIEFFPFTQPTASVSARAQPYAGGVEGSALFSVLAADAGLFDGGGVDGGVDAGGADGGGVDAGGAVDGGGVDAGSPDGGGVDAGGADGGGVDAGSPDGGEQPSTPTADAGDGAPLPVGAFEVGCACGGFGDSAGRLLALGLLAWWSRRRARRC